MLEGTTAEIKPRKALRINPAKTCQPIGAMYAALGIHGCMPHSHGSQGCCAYHRSHLTRHLKEPVVATTSSFTEGASVFGGLANLSHALYEHLHDLQPGDCRGAYDLLSEVIGDDIPMMIRKAAEEGTIPKGRYVIHANTPSFVGSHVTGFANMTTAMVRYLGEKHGHRAVSTQRDSGFPGSRRHPGTQTHRRRDGDQARGLPGHQRRAGFAAGRALQDVSARRGDDRRPPIHRRQLRARWRWATSRPTRRRRSWTRSAGWGARFWSCPSA